MTHNELVILTSNALNNKLEEIIEYLPIFTKYSRKYYTISKKLSKYIEIT